MRLSVTSTPIERPDAKRPKHHFFGTLDHPAGVVTYENGDVELNVRDGERNYRVSIDREAALAIRSAINRRRRKTIKQRLNRMMGEPVSVFTLLGLEDC